MIYKIISTPLICQLLQGTWYLVPCKWHQANSLNSEAQSQDKYRPEDGLCLGWMQGVRGTNSILTQTCKALKMTVSSTGTTWTTSKILTGNQPSVFPVPGLLNSVDGNHINMQIAFFENV